MPKDVNPTVTLTRCRIVAFMGGRLRRKVCSDELKVLVGDSRATVARYCVFGVVPYMCIIGGCHEDSGCEGKIVVINGSPDNKWSICGGRKVADGRSFDRNSAESKDQRKRSEDHAPRMWMYTSNCESAERQTGAWAFNARVPSREMMNLSDAFIEKLVARQSGEQG
jgi:hypothetical protein